MPTPSPFFSPRWGEKKGEGEKGTILFFEILGEVQDKG